MSEEQWFQLLSNHTNQAMLICKSILEEYQEHGHDFEWQKHLLPRLCNLGGYIVELIKAMDEEMTIYKEQAGETLPEEDEPHAQFINLLGSGGILQ